MPIIQDRSESVAASELAIGMITREHQLVETMLQTLLRLINDVEKLQSEPDFPLLAAELNFMEDFQDGHHHPLEEYYLFRPLRRRAPDMIPIMDELNAEYMRGSAALTEMAHALVRYHGGAQDGFRRFKSIIDTYADMMMGRISVENALHERARECLTTEEWLEISCAFEANSDSPANRVPREELQRLRQRIVLRLPQKFRTPALREARYF